MRIPRAIVAWAADRESAGARRWVQISLGAIWLLDAALQYQPYMFSRAFTTGVIEPAGAGSPGFVAGPVMFAGQFMLHNQVAFNAGFATIQLALGVGLLYRRTVRAALAGSIVWALSIWWLGEGLGGIFTSTATPVTGAPGAALLYALIAALAWPARSPEARGARVFGGILTGQGTDPNTGPLLILLAAAFWPLAGASRKLAEASPQAGRSAEASLLAGDSARLPESVAAGARGLGLARVRSQQAVPRRAALIGWHIRDLSPFPGPSGRLAAPNSARE